MKRRLSGTVIGAVIGLLLGTSGSSGPGPDIGGRAEDDSAIIEGLLTGGAAGPARTATAQDPNAAYLRSAQCPNVAPGTVDTPICPDGVGPVLVATCPSGERGIPPLWIRTRDATTASGWTPWRLLPGSGGCPGDPGFPAITAADFQRLPLTPSAIHIQPPTGWTLANVQTIVYASNDPQTLRTTVLGLGVTVRASPTRFTWSFGDGSAPFATTDPGKPYPEATISHAYRAEGIHRIALATQWTGEFLVDGFATWLPVNGTAQTATTSEPLSVYTARSRLVADPT